jgi:ubiquinone/menaquinone biosynthesis C-methylase UbiE
MWMNAVDDMNKYARSCQSEFWQEIFSVELDFIQRHLSGGERILSVGCGPAIIEQHLSERGFEVTGLDISRAALELAPDGVRTVVGTAEEMPFGEFSFDAVIFVASLQFIEDFRKAVAEARRVLRPEGRILVLLLNPESGFFRDKSKNADSYVRRIRHMDLKNLEWAIAENFSVQTEYFLGVLGDTVFSSSDPSEAVLYAVSGTCRTDDEVEQP